MDVEKRDWHNCHFCGELVKHGHDSEGKRHYLSDCRPDLVEHEPGETCTWYGMSHSDRTHDCYAYQDLLTRQWTDEHKHFYNDGPM